MKSLTTISAEHNETGYEESNPEKIIEDIKVEDLNLKIKPVTGYHYVVMDIRDFKTKSLEEVIQQIEKKGFIINNRSRSQIETLYNDFISVWDSKTESYILTKEIGESGEVERLVISFNSDYIDDIKVYELYQENEFIGDEVSNCLKDDLYKLETMDLRVKSLDNKKYKIYKLKERGFDDRSLEAKENAHLEVIEEDISFRGDIYAFVTGVSISIIFGIIGMSIYLFTSMIPIIMSIFVTGIGMIIMIVMMSVVADILKVMVNLRRTKELELVPVSEYIRK